MKYWQNQGRILLPGEAFEAPQDDNEMPGATLYTPGVLQANTTETISLQIDKDLLNKIRTLSAADKEIQEIWRKKASGTTRDGKIALGLCEEISRLLMYDSLIWIPDNNTLLLRILRDHHDAQATGHPGRARTLELVSRNFYWPGQRKYVHRYVDHCDTCHRIKPIRHASFGLLKPLELPHRPWDTISTDFISALPTSQQSTTPRPSTKPRRQSLTTTKTHPDNPTIEQTGPQADRPVHHPGESRLTRL